MELSQPFDPRMALADASADYGLGAHGNVRKKPEGTLGRGPTGPLAGDQGNQEGQRGLRAGAGGTLGAGRPNSQIEVLTETMPVLRMPPRHVLLPTSQCLSPWQDWTTTVVAAIAIATAITSAAWKLFGN